MQYISNDVCMYPSYLQQPIAHTQPGLAVRLGARCARHIFLSVPEEVPRETSRRGPCLAHFLYPVIWGSTVWVRGGAGGLSGGQGPLLLRSLLPFVPRQPLDWIRIFGRDHLSRSLALIMTLRCAPLLSYNTTTC